MITKIEEVEVICGYCTKLKKVAYWYYEQSTSKLFFCNNVCKGKWMGKLIRGKKHHNWKEKVEVNCAFCNKERTVYPYQYKEGKNFFCNCKCSAGWKQKFLRGKDHPLWKEKIGIPCPTCGNLQKVYPVDYEQSVSKNFFCNRKCMGLWLSKNNRGENHYNWKKKVVVSCANCGRLKEVYSRDYEKSTSKNFFCNDSSCEGDWKSINLRGENNHHWRGGPSTEEEAVRASEEYQEWRSMVFGRDNYTCQICFKRGIYLHAHHIKEFSKYPELRIIVFNGITLCRECHNKVRHHEEEWIEYFEGRLAVTTASTQTVEPFG